MLNYYYSNGNQLVGKDGSYPGTVTNSCTETNGQLENAVIIDEKSYDTLVGAMNAWVADNGGSSYFQLWICDDLGVDHHLEVQYIDEHIHQLKCTDCTYAVNEEHQTVLENDKEATCSTEGHTGDEVCEICHTIVKKGEIIEKLDHHFIDGKCSVCGVADPDHHIQTDVTDTTQITNTENNTIHTGDSTNVTMWIAILVAALIVIIGIIVYQKKIKRNKR